jgi:hypothetical protein
VRLAWLATGLLVYAILIPVLVAALALSLFVSVSILFSLAGAG